MSLTTPVKKGSEENLANSGGNATSSSHTVKSPFERVVSSSSVNNGSGGPSIRSGFILGPEDLNDVDTPVTAPRLFLNSCFENRDEATCSEKEPLSAEVNCLSLDSELYLIVYRSHSITLCFVIEGESLMKISVYQELDAFVGPHVRSLAQTMAQQLIGPSASSGKKAVLSSSPKTARKLNSSINSLDNSQSGIFGNQYRYIYFNEMNLAIKSTIHTVKGISSVPGEALRLINELHSVLMENENEGSADRVACYSTEKEEYTYKADAKISELMMFHEQRSSGSFWAVGKRSEGRQVFSVFSQKNASVADVGEEMKRLNSLYFNNIFAE